MLKLYGIYYTFYSFEEDESQGKNRPIIILDPNNLNKGFYITSSNKYDDEDYSYPIQKYQGTGLKKSSWIRFDKAVKNLKDSECKLIGFLDPFDIKYSSIIMNKFSQLTESSNRNSFLLSPFVKKFLEKNKNLLNNNMPELYDEANFNREFAPGEFTPLLTNTLLQAGIDPLTTLNYIPEFYMYADDKLEYLIIPDNIIEIGKNAFEYCKNLKNITISKNVKNIDHFAFSNCFNIQTLKIESLDFTLGLGAFEKFIASIIYNGTYEQWQNLCNKNKIELETNRLICKDKVIAK